jgi:carbon monoxide dehydrogenase subunit G
MVLAFALALTAAAPAATLESMLAKGELTLLETFPDGRLKQVTAVGLLDAPVDTVWAVLVDFGGYTGWMPKVRESRVVSNTGNEWVVDWTISVVGPDIKSRQKIVVDPDARTIMATQLEGGMPGSRWSWKLSDQGSKTLAERTVRVNVVESNWFIKQIEDEQHTLDYGINTAVGVVELRGLERKLAGN